MAILSDLVQKKKSGFVVNEENIENGMIWSYMMNTSANMDYNDGSTNQFCWLSPGTGTVIIEVWGAGGSAGSLGCCGGGTPGNSGAYSKKTICVDPSSYITGNTGKSCLGTTTCFKGCSEPSMLAWYATTCGCICAQGGKGGVTCCLATTSSSIACCFIAGGFCNNRYCNSSNGCFWIKNDCSGSHLPSACGGDINCSGRIGCTAFKNCNPCCNCFQEAEVPLPYGFYSKTGSSVTIPAAYCYGICSYGGAYANNIRTAFEALGNPSSGSFPEFCWQGSVQGNCSWWGCTPMMPPGTGAPPVLLSDSCCDRGLAGGFGAIRIKFISD